MDLPAPLGPLISVRLPGSRASSTPRSTASSFRRDEAGPGGVRPVGGVEVELRAQAQGLGRARHGVGLDPAQLLLGGAHVAGDGALHLLGEELLGVLVLVRRGPVGVPTRLADSRTASRKALISACSRA